MDFRNNIMDILWEPEHGTCTECGDSKCLVRRYSSCGRSRTFCFACWSREQNPYVMSSQDWSDDECVTFEFPKSEFPSRAA